MICGSCGRRMKIGKFKISVHGIATISGYAYPKAEWYDGDNLVCETDVNETMGFYCDGCGVMLGVFFRNRQVGFTSEYSQDLDDRVDHLPKKECPDCGAELDIDFPRCPECGFIFGTRRVPD